MVKNDSNRSRKGGGRVAAAFYLGLIAFCFFNPSVDAASRSLNRNRSIYVPVRFEACEHMENVELSIAGESYTFGLGKRIFLFTYYADKKAVLPEFTEVWIEGESDTADGVRSMRTNLVVTPGSIQSSLGSLTGREREIEKQLRRRRDARLPESVIRIQCREQCLRTQN